MIIFIELYPTRVEITSPGVFPGLAKMNDLLNISRFARNPRIARVCTEFGFGQELGEGIKRIVEQMRACGYIGPIYSQNSGSVKLRLEAIMRLDDKLLRELPSKSEEILNIVRLHPHGIGTGEIMGALEMTRPTV
ncbi:MAG: ATP-binding protein, partial [Candidatus Micrarchaeaceae archaeon]